MIFSEFPRIDAKKPFPKRDIMDLLTAGKCPTIGWRGTSYLVFLCFEPHATNPSQYTSLCFKALDSWKVICYLSGEGEVSYPGEVRDGSKNAGEARRDVRSIENDSTPSEDV